MVDKATAQLGGERRGTSPPGNTRTKNTREHRDAERPDTPGFPTKETPVTQKDTHKSTHDRGRRGDPNTTPDPAPVNTHPTEGKPNQWGSPHTTKGKPDHRGTEKRDATPRREEAITTTIAVFVLLMQ